MPVQPPSEQPSQCSHPRERCNDADAAWPTLPTPRLDALRRLGDAEQEARSRVAGAFADHRHDAQLLRLSEDISAYVYVERSPL